MQEWKTWHQTAGVENVRTENSASNCRNEKCENGKCGKYTVWKNSATFKV